MRFLRVIAIVLAVTAFSRNASAVGEEVGGFPNWAERVIHEWMNRARCDPKVEMMACDFGPPANGHRWNILKVGPALARADRTRAIRAAPRRS
jgi:hypothetical protein